jgi:hypothetical protein
MDFLSPGMIDDFLRCSLDVIARPAALNSAWNGFSCSTVSTETVVAEGDATSDFLGRDRVA